MSKIDRRAFLATTSATAAVAATPALAQGGSEDAKLRTLLDRIFEEGVDESPRRATSLGLDKDRRAHLKGKLDDVSMAARAKRLERSRGYARELKAIDRTKLSAASRIDLDVVLYSEERAVYGGDTYKFGSAGRNYSPYVLSQQDGAYSDIPDFLDSQHRVTNAADAEAYLSRLSAYRKVLNDELERFRHDTGMGVIPPTFAIDLTVGQLKAQRGAPAASSVMVTSIAEKARKVNVPGDWAARAQKIVETEIFPAYDRQLAALEGVKPKSRPDFAAWGFPNGAAYYADAVKASTTTNYTPDQVHEIGRTQVAEITAEIDKILKSQGLTQGTVAQRLVALNNDPKQKFPETDAGRAQIMALLNEQIAACYALLPKAFRTLPKAKVEARRVPEFIQDGASNGYYQSPALDGSRPGVFYINLKLNADWPRYNLASLAYHETVPGHHMQIALAQESDKIPIARRTGYGASAYSEGWGLYAEQLADEMGVYEGDPLGRAGYLQSLLFRAARLVTDTGIHSKRWTREQATQYFVDTIGNTRTRAQREVERYFVSPGQATSYKMGHNVWVKLRQDARAKLGPKFDLAGFHDAGLLSGNMPLTVLERHIQDWAASQA